MKKEKCKCCKVNNLINVEDICASCRSIISASKGRVEYLKSVIKFLSVDTFAFDKKDLFKADNDVLHKKIITELFASSDKFKYNDLLVSLREFLQNKGITIGYNKLVDLIKLYRENGWIRNDRHFKAA